MALPLNYWTLRRKRKSLQKVYTKIGNLNDSGEDRQLRPLERLEIEAEQENHESFKMFFNRLESKSKSENS